MTDYHTLNEINKSKIYANPYGVIYKWENLFNGKIYIGLSTSILVRYNSHLSDARTGKGNDLHTELNKYGLKYFSFDIICSCCEFGYLGELENYFIDYYDSYNKGYNLTRGEGHWGHKQRQVPKTICKSELVDNAAKNFRAINSHERRNEQSRHRVWVKKCKKLGYIKGTY